MITQIELAQMATFLDSEGSIVISNRGDGSYSIRIQVSNTDIRLMMWLKERFGGGFSAVRAANARCKPSFIWGTNCRKAATVLQQCLPYFILKREQAEVALAYQALLEMGRNQQRPLSEVDVQAREGLRTQMRILNKRGVDAA